MKMTIITLFLLGWTFLADAYTYHTGRCELVTPMASFDMNRFLGIWYGIHGTSTDESCVIYKISAGSRPGEYQVEKEHYNQLTRSTSKSSGKITFADPTNPARLSVQFSGTGVLGSSTWTIFATDYNNYAGAVECQNIGITHRRSINVLSRSRTLTPESHGAVYRRLHEINVVPSHMTTIRHVGCVNTIF